MGHLSLLLHDGPSTLFFAGDTSYSEQLMLDGVIDGVSTDVGAARQTLLRIKQLAREQPLVYLPSHDPAAAARLEARQAITFGPSNPAR